MGSVNLVEQLRELREIFHYGKDAWNKVWEKNTELPCLFQAPTLPKSPCVHQLGNSPNPVLMDFYGGDITQKWLIKSLATGDWFNLQSLSCPQGLWGWDWKLQLSNRKIGSSGNHPWPSVWSKSHLMNITKDIRLLYGSHPLGNPKGFRSLCQQWGQRPNIDLL